MRHCSTLLLFLVLMISYPTHAMSSSPLSDNLDLRYPDDSLLNSITNIDKRLKKFTIKDTIGGFSSPRKIETSSYFKARQTNNEPKRDRQGLIIVPLEYEPFLSYTSFVDTVIFSPVMLPVVFDGRMLPRNLDYKRTAIFPLEIPMSTLIDKDSIISPELYKYKQFTKSNFKLIDKDSTNADKLWEIEKVLATRKQYYTDHPERVKSDAFQFDGTAIATPELEKKNPFKELISAGEAIQIASPEVETYKIKQIFWKTSGEHNLNISQASYSDNWNPKSNDNYRINNYHKFNATYRKNKVEFTHWVEWRLNVQSVSLSSEDKEKNPDYNSFLINDDWVQTYNKLGLDAFIKKWSYIFTLTVKTPVFNKYPQNNDNRQAGLFSPLDINFGLGAGYNYERNSTKVKDRGFKISVDATPFSLDMRHIGSREVYRNNNHGVVDKKDPEKPRYTKTEFGSNINITLQYRLNNFTNFNTRNRYFTNYERAYLECENTINFKLNRYLSTSLYVYMKFDDSDKNRKDKTWGYFSFNEVLGFGLSYTWN